ncbi:MAG TPA: ABC transporter permease subunit [Planctomycetota bacterium]|nr:ABC transporter permease subunit [Planctomycetota bacterium]
MRWLKWQAPLPLLSKDLAEQAARRRTYIARVAYAALLFLIFLVASHSEFEVTDAGSAASSGRGLGMFDALIKLQFAGILLFLPAMMSGALTYEKERGSLALLLLTTLKPRAILMQKYLGRLVPMFSILLLGLPLLAICYTFGGLTTDYLATGAYVLVLTSLQVGALALLCSSFCCTSLGALLASYILVATLYLGLPLLLTFLGAEGPNVFFLVPLSLFPDPGARSVSFDSALFRSWLIAASVVAFLVLAQVFLVARAFREPRNRLLGLFRWLDRFFERVNAAIGGLRVGRHRESLPADHPIAWREVSRRSLGRPLYLFRILVLLEVPTLFIAASVIVFGEWRHAHGLISQLFYGLAILAAIAVSVTSANAIAAERTSQTLDVLLTTPIAGRDIVREKVRGVRRLRRVLLVPLATLLLVELWLSQFSGGSYYWRRQRPVIADLGLTFAAVALFLVLFSWVAVRIALRVRTRSRAIMATLATLVGWNVVPPLAFFLIAQASGVYRAEEHLMILLYFSPAICVVGCEQGFLLRSYRGDSDGTMLLVLLLYLLLAAVYRGLCLRGADRHLGRAVGRADRPRPLSAGSVCGILTPEDVPPSEWE